jgi:uncharacterized protein (DUF2062 family)
MTIKTGLSRTGSNYLTAYSLLMPLPTTLLQLRDKLLGINDSTQRIALGAGLGLFLGVFPGTGPIAAIVMAFIFRVNKAASLAGALAVNTWINVVTFPLAIALGAFATGADPADIGREWSHATNPFIWKTFVAFLFHRGILTVVAGYVVIGCALAGIGYAVTFAIISRVRRSRDA